MGDHVTTTVAMNGSGSSLTHLFYTETTAILDVKFNNARPHPQLGFGSAPSRKMSGQERPPLTEEFIQNIGGARIMSGVYSDNEVVLDAILGVALGIGEFAALPIDDIRGANRDKLAEDSLYFKTGRYNIGGCEIPYVELRSNAHAGPAALESAVRTCRMILGNASQALDWQPQQNP